jgi:eukaryotic-like serine/threonine-protein kinase
MASSAHMETERQPGAIIGPYRLVEPLGEGGMGEVWKAADTRLGRTVAIKFAKSQFTERSEREARAVAALNHRHIATLYDVGPDYLVMEYVEGTPIKGPLPAAKAVALTGQICEALAAAHREGIVHRDLKPANILLTRQGVKLLDFGVAKFDAAREAASGADAETITGEHVFVGTPNYMAPEQLENHTADARSDIFALGCVVYELLAGERAFEGKSVASVASAVLSTEPAPLAERQPLTPPAVEAVLRKCLAKDPEERWQAALDVKFAFEQALAAPAAAGAKPRPWPRRLSLRRGSGCCRRRSSRSTSSSSTRPAGCASRSIRFPRTGGASPSSALPTTRRIRCGCGRSIRTLPCRCQAQKRRAPCIGRRTRARWRLHCPAH